jgi:glycogen debranching enzyme
MTSRSTLAVPEWAPRIEATGVPELAKVYGLAVATLDANIVSDGNGRAFIRAGAGYPTPWTRDASLNAWGAASILRPEIAGTTLQMVCEDGPDGPVIAQDDQWWDQIIWVIAAEQHSRTTGDRDFLTKAYGIGVRSLRILAANRFDSASGLYGGPSLMQDGIAGFPAPPATDPEHSSFVLDYPATHTVACLSTNAVYVGALRALGRMAGELGEQSAPWEERADRLSEAIESGLWDESRRAYGYFRNLDGSLDPSQEAAGIGLLAALDVVPARRAAQVLGELHQEPYGHVNVWPPFERYDQDHPGRHNVMCWPMVMGLVGLGAIKHAPALARTILDQLHSLVGRDNRFWEIYEPRTGRPSGGWQVGREWPPLIDQTWSATSYLRLVHCGVLGMDPQPDGLHFTDHHLPGLGTVRATGVPWREALLDLTIEGAGPIVRVRLDGHDVTRQDQHVPADLTGPLTVQIERSAR